MKVLIAVAASAALLSGCASAIRGTTSKVLVTSEPSGAAVRTSLGDSCPATPCTLVVSRKATFTAYAQLEGYKPGSIFIGTRTSTVGAAATAANMMATGFVGTAIDSSTGAALDHHPNPAHIVLIPEEAKPAATQATPETQPAAPADPVNRMNAPAN